MDKAKKAYASPKLVEYGRMEQLTRGIFGPSPDWAFGDRDSGGSGPGGRS